jgi:TonB-linked SusC/RagA family outer membrane protein
LLLAVPLSLRAQQAPQKNIDSIGATIINVPFGKQTKQSLTAAISSVSGRDLRKTQTAALSNTLFGRLPGLAAVQTDGEPGFDEGSLYIRGQHTLRDNGYIVLLDGFEIDGFNQITPDEIESLSVLKDAAALAMYGISGANGAILITTKRGIESKKLNVAFNARYGVQAPQFMPKLRDSYDYASLYNEALKNDGLSQLYTQKQLDGYKNGADPYLYPNVNWYDQALKKIAAIQDYTLTFNGGNNFARYFVMGGFMNNSGLYANTDNEYNSNIKFNRYNFRANVDLNLTRSLVAQIDLGGRVEDRKYPANIATADLWRSFVTYAPNLYSVYTPDGQLTGTANFPDNPVGRMLGRGWDSRHSRDIQARVRLQQKLDAITKGLSVFANISTSSAYQSAYYKTRTYAYAEPIVTTSTLGEDSLYYLQRGVNTDLVVGTSGDTESDRMAAQFGFQYANSFGSHDVEALVMYQQDKYSLLGDQSAYTKRNIMGRLRYAFLQKYYAEAAISYSGTGNYAPGKRFGFFPALSGGWILSQENFLKHNKTINFLKLRGSVGLVGNDKGAGRFSYNQYWEGQANAYYWGTATSGSAGIIQSALANPDITWEKSMMANIGAEARFFKNRLSIEAHYFYERRYDGLVNMNDMMPGLSGLTSASYVNRAVIHNRGVELSATYNDRIGSFNYFIGGQFAFIRNKVMESYETPKAESYRYVQGNPIGQRFGLEATGFFKDELEIASNPTQAFTTVQPGDLKYKDQNNDGIIDVNDEKAIGKPPVPEINYSFNLGASYKGFDIEFLFQGNANRSVYLTDYTVVPFVNNANISEWAAEGRWTPETKSSATFPRLSTISNQNNYRASGFWVRDIALLRLRNAELGYTLPGKALSKAKIEKLRLFVSAVNLFTIDNLYPRLDPETLSTGYPTLKTYSFGLNLNF